MDVEDHGKGFAPPNGQTGIGLIAMRERAGILGGTLNVGPATAGGTIVQLRIPRDKVEVHGE
jgi:signal transduction histidine kinase